MPLIQHLERLLCQNFKSSFTQYVYKPFREPVSHQVSPPGETRITAKSTSYWACTVPECETEFQSSKDWRRHENQFHWPQKAIWRCGQGKKGNEVHACAQIFHEFDAYRSHLLESHDVLESQIARPADNYMGRNWQIGYWCGFCVEIVRPCGQGLDAVKERLDHMENHFAGGQTVQDWRSVDDDGCEPGE